MNININKCCNCECDLRNYTSIIINNDTRHACSVECMESYLAKGELKDSQPKEVLLNG